MGDLKYRAYLNTTLPKELIEQIRQLSRKTRIPISRLSEEAYADLLHKYAMQDSYRKKEK